MAGWVMSPLTSGAPSRCRRLVFHCPPGGASGFLEDMEQRHAQPQWGIMTDGLEALPHSR